MRGKMLLLLLLLLVLLLVRASASPAIADRIETPAQFLTRAYAPYLKNDQAPSVYKREAELFEPSLRALLKKDRSQAHGEVGRLDGDPLCACQDYELLKDFRIATTYSDPEQPELVVHFSNGTQPTEIHALVRRTKAGWRIYDLVEREQGSVRNLLGGKTATKTPPEVTKYFYGPVVYTSALAGRVVGNTSSLVRRMVRPGAAEIEESVLQPGRRPGENAVERVAKLRRIGDTSKFEATDAESSFTGTMTFVGKEWAYTSWTYDLALSAGGTLVGTGTVGPEGLKTQKTLADNVGSPSMVITETLETIDKDRYETLRATLLQ